MSTNDWRAVVEQRKNAEIRAVMDGMATMHRPQIEAAAINTLLYGTPAWGAGHPGEIPASWLTPSFVVSGAFDNTLEERPSEFSPDILTAAREQGAREERAKIMAKLETCRPTETQYTRREWRWEEKGAQAMFDKIMKALGEDVQGA
jgi:hypothetical protein